MKARKYNSRKLQELLDEITPEEMEETKQQMLKQIEMEKQTAVDWLEAQLMELITFNTVEMRELYRNKFKQAKQIEKEQIVEAFYQGVDQESDTHGAMNLDRIDAESYYNQTFKTK